jgi:hypothetical protein
MRRHDVVDLTVAMADRKVKSIGLFVGCSLRAIFIRFREVIEIQMNGTPRFGLEGY